MYELDAWEETSFYCDRERAALAWTEAVTMVAETHVPDALYEEVRKQFEAVAAGKAVIVEYRDASEYKEKVSTNGRMLDWIESQVISHRRLTPVSSS